MEGACSVKDGLDARHLEDIVKGVELGNVRDDLDLEARGGHSVRVGVEDGLALGV
jgi:hypothetical protein